MSAVKIVTDERVVRYVAEKGETVIFPPFTAMGLERDGRIVAGFVFNNLVARNIEVSVAGEGDRAARRLLRAVGAYVFGQLNCLRISITTRQSKVGDLALRLGGQPEGIRRNFYGKDDHAMLFGILREDWTVR